MGGRFSLTPENLLCFSSDSYVASFFFSSLSSALVDAKEIKELFD